MTNQISRMRRAISGLSRADLRKLATDAGISRDDLSDFADVEISLPGEALAKLNRWHDTYSLRVRLNDHRSVHQFHAMVEATGIDATILQGFMSGEVETLSDEQHEAVLAFTRGMIPAKPTIERGHATSSSLPAVIVRRSQLLRDLGRLPVPELERLLSLARKAA